MPTWKHGHFALQQTDPDAQRVQQINAAADLRPHSFDWRGDEDVPDGVWEKRLYVLRSAGVILHIRRSDSPWGRYTVWFRDWLRAHPAERERYEKTKRQLVEQNVGKPDYDDYTRAKAAFFDEVQQEFVEWAPGVSPGEKRIC